MPLNRTRVLEEVTKAKKKKILIKEKLKELEDFETTYLIDPGNLVEQIRTCLVKSHKWAKISAFITKSVDELEVTLEYYESLLWTEFKREYKDMGDKTFKEADIRAKVRGDETRKKIKLMIAEFRYYNNLVRDGCFWPSTRLIDAAKELGQALRVANMSFTPMARKEEENE